MFYKLTFAITSLLSPAALLAQGSAARPIGVEPVPVEKPLASVLAARQPSYTVKAPGSGAWVDTGIMLTQADHLDVSADGIVQLGDGRKCEPAGVARGWKDLLRSLPAVGADTGELIGRIGNADAAVPFAIGSAISEDVPANGELFVAVNTAGVLAGTGAYTATIRLSKATISAAAPAIDLQQALTPALFAGLPQRVVDAQGDPGDLVNFALLGTQAQVMRAFAGAGWVQVDKTNNEAMLHGLLATLSKQEYVSVPMSVLFLFGRPQDFSYARADQFTVALVRHHLRLWSAGRTVGGQPLWIGSATHDNGLERDQRDNGVTHRIDPDIDVERDFIRQSFTTSGGAVEAAYVTPASPIHEAHTATGGSFTTDGRILVMLVR